jgi:hypothetical protein
VSDPAPVRGFFQRWRTTRGVERARIDGETVERALPADGTVSEVPTAISEVRIATAAVLRLLAYPLLASPLLMIPKLVSPRRVSDHLTVAFALVVVVFFATLAFYLIVTYAWWKRRDLTRLRFAPPAADDTSIVVTHPSEAAVGTRVRGRGRVVAVDDTRVVLRAVAGDDGKSWRLVEAVPFAVVPRDGLPLVADVQVAPLVLGATRGISAGEVAERFAGETLGLADTRDGGDYLEIAVGDEVELAGPVARIVPDADQFVLGGATRGLPAPSDNDPYRSAAGPALIVGGDAAPRLVVRAIPRAAD